MKKFIMVALILCFGLISTPASAQINAKELTNSPLDLEAKIQATKVFEGLLTKCGEKYYMWNDEDHGWPIEFKEKPIMEVGSLPVSEMQKLNGLEWQGMVAFSSSAERIHRPNQTWSWGWNSHSFGLSKSSGVWMYTSYMGKRIPSDNFSDNIPCEKASEPPKQ